MFNEFKKDKITKLIQSEKSALYKDLKNNNINLLEAHYIMEDKISQIYKENQFHYQDILNRKKTLTVFRNNVNNVMISLIFGILSGIICNGFFEICEIISSFNVILSTLLIMFILPLIEFLLIKTIFNTAKTLTDNDLYNVDSYELDIIENILQEYENKKTRL